MWDRGTVHSKNNKKVLFMWAPPGTVHNKKYNSKLKIKK